MPAVRPSSPVVPAVRPWSGSTGRQASSRPPFHSTANRNPWPGEQPPTGKGNVLNREDALALLHEHTKTDSLRKHALGVEAAMRHYAGKYGEDEEKWGIVGLLHDFDYEATPDPKDHPMRGGEDPGGRGGIPRTSSTPSNPTPPTSVSNGAA